MAKVYVDKALEKLNILRHSEREIVLKKEQETAVENLILRNDVLTVLPLERIYLSSIYFLAKQEFERQANNDATVCIVIISPQTSIQLCDL